MARIGKMIPMSPNRLGWITSLSFEHHRGMIDVSSHAGPEFIRGVSTIRGSLDFMANDPGALHEFLQGLQNDQNFGPSVQTEFMCLYCGTPNLLFDSAGIPVSCCKKCGGPRSFLIG